MSLYIKRFFFLLAIGGLFYLAATDPVYAGGTDIEQETQVDVAGATVTSGGSRAYGFSGADMVINDCLATHSVLFGLWQNTHLNPACMADKLDSIGRHEEAAEMRCSIRRFKKVYGANCVEETMYQPEPEIEEVVIVADYEDEWREEQLQMQLDYEARIEKLEQKVNKPRVIRETVVEQKPWMTDEKRAALEKVLAE